MAAPTLSQVHIDSAMTRVSIAYRNENYIADQIFPVVPVNHQSDEYFYFDKASWFRDEAGPRAPGTRGPQVEYSISSCTYACRPIAATKLVPDEIVANADSPLQPRRDATTFATDKLMLFMERDVAGKVFVASTWTGSHTISTTWDDDASEPLDDVATAREGIVSTIGREPNVMVIGRNVWTDLKNHPDILDRIKYVSTGVVTVDLLAQLFEVEKLLIGNAIYTATAENSTATYEFIWGKHAWMGWVPPNAALMVPAAGYIFAWKNRIVERFRREEEKTDAIRAEANYAVEVTSADAGYYMPNAVA